MDWRKRVRSVGVSSEWSAIAFRDRLYQSWTLLGVCQRLGRAVLTRFAPCTIAALERSGHTAVMEWDGWRKTWIPDADSRLPLCSSSFDPESVAESRRREFARILEGSGVSGIGHLLAFHRSHAPQRGPYSTCMHRADAETVSFTWVSVTASEISLYYAPGAPCRSVAGWSETMALAPEESTGCLVCC